MICEDSVGLGDQNLSPSQPMALSSLFTRFLARQEPGGTGHQWVSWKSSRQARSLLKCSCSALTWGRASRSFSRKERSFSQRTGRYLHGTRGKQAELHPATCPARGLWLSRHHPGSLQGLPPETTWSPPAAQGWEALIDLGSQPTAYWQASPRKPLHVPVHGPQFPHL